MLYGFMNNTKIFAAERSFDIGCRVVKWDEPGGFDFTPKGKYNKRDMSFDQLSPLMKQFCVHYSVTYRASHMFNGLNARGLSCNFMIDDDVNEQGFATIYQTLDIKNGAWSQGGAFNNMGPGVEISYMPQAWEKDMYTPWLRQKWKVQPHETVIAPVHGTKLKVHLPTKAQIASLLQLMWGFIELFPYVPAKFPRTPHGFHVTTKLDKPEQYTGFVNHYHLKRSKIDTVGLDMEMIEKEIETRRKCGF
jgi:hypothetical protein